MTGLSAPHVNRRCAGPWRGRLLPPEPGDEAINKAIEAGVIDAGDLTRARTAAQVARIAPEPAGDPGSRPASDALARMRAGER